MVNGSRQTTPQDAGWRRLLLYVKPGLVSWESGLAGLGAGFLQQLLNLTCQSCYETAEPLQNAAVTLHFVFTLVIPFSIYALKYFSCTKCMLVSGGFKKYALSGQCDYVEM